jgi:hypothetical protein
MYFESLAERGKEFHSGCTLMKVRVENPKENDGNEGKKEG